MIHNPTVKKTQKNACVPLHTSEGAWFSAVEVGM